MFEGGNLAIRKDAQFPFSADEELQLLTTNKNYQVNYFDVINATSAATALASRFAGKLHNFLRKIELKWSEDFVFADMECLAKTER